MDTEYYLNRIEEMSLKIGALQYHVKHLADLILSLPADSYTRGQAEKSLESMKNLDAWAKELMADKPKMTPTEGR